MRRTVWILSSIWLGMAPAAAGGETLAEFERALDALRIQYRIPGLAAAVVRNQQIVWERGFGYADLEKQTPVAPDTPFRIASVTKVFASTLLMQCVERGVLSLDDPIARYTLSIPEPGVTVRHVLTHTSASVPPGDRFSNDGNRFLALTPVVDSCAGIPFREALAKNILHPLKMWDSVPGQDLENVTPAMAGSLNPEVFDRATLDRYRRVLERLAVPYARNGQGEPVRSSYPNKIISASAGLVSTVRDLALFDAAIDQHLLLKPETQELAWRPAVTSKGQTLPYALGWFSQTVSGRRLIWHYGHWPNASSSLYLKIPERQVSLFLLANADTLSSVAPLGGGDITGSPFANLFLKLEDTPPAPAIAANGVVNAASYIRSGFPNSGIAQGSLFVVFGRDLGPAGLKTFDGLPKPTSLAGTSVRVFAGGTTVDAYLYYTSSGQVAAILPSNTPLGDGTVTVTYNGAASAPAPIRIVRSAPGIFTRNQAGYGQAILQNVVSPAAWPLNEATEAAQPGQAAVLWGTGLGPIEGGDAGAPPVGNVPGDVEVLVGNRPVRPFYYGRSGGFPGIDQINFLVPEGVEGCRVPVAVRVDGVTGNYASMAIAAGKTCSDPVSLAAADAERLREKRDGKAAWIRLNRLRFALGSNLILNDEGIAEIVRGDLAAMQANGTLGDSAIAPPPGTCTVYTLPEPGDSLVLEPEPVEYRQPLDAGPALSVSGPKGQKYLFRGLYGGYEASLGSGTAGSPEYLSPGEYSVDNGSGGAGLGPLQARLTIPPPLNWTNETEIGDIPRTADLTVTWSGGDAEREFVLIAGVSVNTATRAQASFVCSERVTAGRFTVPASVLSSLPVSSEWTGAGVPSVLTVTSLPLPARMTFTAGGLDLGLFRYLNVRGKTVRYREASTAWPAASWNRVESLEKAGWSRERLDIARAFAGYIGSAAVMIVEGGLVVDEWGETATRYWLHSARKSVLSALYGAPVQEGLIRLDETMGELGIDDNPPSLTPEEKQATVRQLLQARSGVYHAALAESAGMAAARPARGSHPPGTFWYYNNWDFNVLGTIFERKTGRGIFEEVKRRLADPLQMEDFRLEDGYYMRGAESIHPAYPMRFTARDMARFGLLCLRQGQWRGQQIIPRDWLRESTTSYSDAGEAGGYGYMWWVAVDGRHLPGMTMDDGAFSARGAYGQYVVVIPARDLVVVHRVNSDVEGNEVTSSEFGRLLRMILEAKVGGA